MRQAFCSVEEDRAPGTCKLTVCVSTAGENSQLLLRITRRHNGSRHALEARHVHVHAYSNQNADIPLLCWVC